MRQQKKELIQATDKNQEALTVCTPLTTNAFASLFIASCPPVHGPFYIPAFSSHSRRPEPTAAGAMPLVFFFNPQPHCPTTSSCKTQTRPRGMDTSHSFPFPHIVQPVLARQTCRGSLVPNSSGDEGKKQWFSFVTLICTHSVQSHSPCNAVSCFLGTAVEVDNVTSISVCAKQFANRLHCHSTIHN